MKMTIKAAVSISILLVLSSFIVLADDSSADDISIELLDENGSKLDPDTPLISKLLIFTTYTDEHGTKYYLDKETVLTEKDYYLRVNAQSGLFHVNASVPSSSITGSLRDAGMEIRIAQSTDYFMAVLDTADSFSSVFKDGTETATIRPNVLYKITILTAHFIQGESQVEKTPEFTLRFEASPIDSYTVVFTDEGKVIETRIVDKDAQIGDLPVLPEKTGYVFDGWYDKDENKVYSTTIVSSDMEIHSKWAQVTSYKVVFTDGEKVIETRNVEKDKPLGDLPVLPGREGWTFDGWFDENDNQVYSTTIVTRDMDVHSKWTQNTCKVVFSDRGTVIETRMVEKDKPLGKLPDEPEREGWTFDGWYDINEKQVYASTIVTGDMEIHSKWKQEPTPPPGPTPPEEKETREEEVIVERDGTVIVIISDLKERVDGTYDL